MKAVMRTLALNPSRVEAEQHQADELQDAHNVFKSWTKLILSSGGGSSTVHTCCTVDHLCRSKHAYIRTVAIVNKWASGI